MTELGETKTNLQLPEEVGSLLPEELHDFVFQKFEDNLNVDNSPPNWFIEHFKSTHPQYGGDFILMYNKNGKISYEIKVTSIDGEMAEDREIVKISKDINGNPARELITIMNIDYKNNTVTTLFSDQNPNDLQL